MCPKANSLLINLSREHLNLERKMESGRLAQDTGRMRFASSARSTNKVQLGIPQTDSTSVFYATLSLSIFLSRLKHRKTIAPQIAAQTRN
jgi:hypothetical protein